MNEIILLCRPCAEQLKTEGKIKIKCSERDKNTCACCGRRKYVYSCESLETSKRNSAAKK